MSSDKTPRPERSAESVLHENVALKKQIEWLSRQLFGRVMPGLYTMSGDGEADSLLPCPDTGDPSDSGGPELGRTDHATGNGGAALHESPAPYRVSAPASVPPDFPSEDVTITLPPKETGGLSILGFERNEAIAMRPSVVRRNIRRTMYVSVDDSGFAAAAPAPALFPDPSGGDLLFDASFVAGVTDLRLAGMSFPSISERMKRESGLAISEESLRGLVLSAAETVMSVCNALVARTIPDWMNLFRMFEEAKAGGDWFAEEFMQKIHALRELEEHARVRASRLGGSPEDLYRERRAVRVQSTRMAASFFDRCREMVHVLDAGSPLAETLRYALEHESFLSGFLYDPRLELVRANPETPVADPWAALAVCADECRLRGVSFRAWLEQVLVRMKQPNPPPPESLFPG